MDFCMSLNSFNCFCFNQLGTKSIAADQYMATCYIPLGKAETGLKFHVTQSMFHVVMSYDLTQQMTSSK